MFYSIQWSALFPGSAAGKSRIRAQGVSKADLGVNPQPRRVTYVMVCQFIYGSG